MTFLSFTDNVGADCDESRLHSVINITALSGKRAHYIDTVTRRTQDMVSFDKVESMLARVGMYNKYWGRAEMRELCRILMDDEEVVAAVNGRYEGGWAMLVATDRRLLLIDKKPWFLGLEDTRYDMVAEVAFTAGMLDSTITIRTINKTLSFRSIRQNKLRSMTAFIQEQVVKLRQPTYDAWQAQAQMTEANPLTMPNPATPVQATRIPPAGSDLTMVPGSPLTRGSLVTRHYLSRLPINRS